MRPQLERLARTRLQSYSIALSAEFELASTNIRGMAWLKLPGTRYTISVAPVLMAQLSTSNWNHPDPNGIDKTSEFLTNMPLKSRQLFKRTLLVDLNMRRNQFSYRARIPLTDLFILSKSHLACFQFCE